MESFSIIFLSILFEAIPFVMIGAIASSIIEIYITSEWIIKKIPKNPIYAYLFAGCLGIIFPVCECAIVPIMRRLIKKGTPVGLAITFMLAVPILNPVVLMSTGYAFPDMPYMVVLRGGLGFLGALIIGSIFSQTKRESIMKEDPYENKFQFNVIQPNAGQKVEIMVQVKKIIAHTSSELYDVGKFLILGAFVSATMQVIVPRVLLLTAGNDPLLSVPLMMVLAFVLSLCSEADAFVASTFKAQFTLGSLVAFLIFGPMIDIKNTIMLLGFFKSRFVTKLILCIAVTCLILALLVNYVDVLGVL